jgi:hypothetical protein
MSGCGCDAYSWKRSITERTLLSGHLALTLDSLIADPGKDHVTRVI